MSMLRWCLDLYNLSLKSRIIRNLHPTLPHLNESRHTWWIFFTWDDVKVGWDELIGCWEVKLLRVGYSAPLLNQGRVHLPKVVFGFIPRISQFCLSFKTLTDHSNSARTEKEAAWALEVIIATRRQVKIHVLKLNQQNIYTVCFEVCRSRRIS